MSILSDGALLDHTELFIHVAITDATASVISDYT